jgi:hypothetical protein
MKTLKPLLWIVIGVVIGASAVGSTPAVEAEQRTAADRFKWTVVAGGADGRSAKVFGRFLYDTVSSGCWLVLQDINDEPRALAPAPRIACD